MRTLIYSLRAGLMLLITIYFGETVLAQKCVEPSKLETLRITLQLDDQIVSTQVLRLNKNIRVKQDKYYMWYNTLNLKITQGGYDGRLIHGTYVSFYLNRQLKEKGELQYGLKTNKWQSWYSNGSIREVVNWKNGLKKGKYFLYNEGGELIAKGHFKKDKLNGKFFTYDSNGKILDVRVYIRGVIQTNETKNKNFKLALRKMIPKNLSARKRKKV